MGALFAIDPGNVESAYCILDADYRPVQFGKVPNEELRSIIFDAKCSYKELTFAIEMVASYGMAVGATVFDTCVWIGRFSEVAEIGGANVAYVYRKDVKMCLCGQTKAKDANIRQALIDRFGVVGTKKEPGWFYGFKSDIWSAYAVGVAYLDRRPQYVVRGGG
jgi:hypothetical protein